MHDPMVVVAQVKVPIPRRARWRDAKNGQPRWTLGRSRRTNKENLGQPTYPWWNLRGYHPVVAGRAYEARSFLTIWHREPKGAASGTYCKYSEMRRHVRHLEVQWHQKQALRRWLFTRCEWCHGPHRKNDPVNVSHQWDRERSGSWWASERGLFHSDCSGIEHAHRTCLCEDPDLSHRGYGKCARCGGFRAWETERPWYHPGDEPTRILKSVPVGQRDPLKTAQVTRIWKDYQDARRYAERAAEELSVPVTP